MNTWTCGYFPGCSGIRHSWEWHSWRWAQGAGVALPPFGSGIFAGGRKGGGMRATGRGLLPLGPRIGIEVEFTGQVDHFLAVCFVGAFANAV